MNREFAKLCLDCDEVYDMTKHEICPICSSQTFWLLSRWLKPIESATIIVEKPLIERKRNDMGKINNNFLDPSMEQ
jgi:hypothetical protein